MWRGLASCSSNDLGPVPKSRGLSSGGCVGPQQASRKGGLRLGVVLALPYSVTAQTRQYVAQDPARDLRAGPSWLSLLLLRLCHCSRCASCPQLVSGLREFLETGTKDEDVEDAPCLCNARMRRCASLSLPAVPGVGWPGLARPLPQPSGMFQFTTLATVLSCQASPQCWRFVAQQQGEGNNVQFRY